MTEQFSANWCDGRKLVRLYTLWQSNPPFNRAVALIGYRGVKTVNVTANRFERHSEKGTVARVTKESPSSIQIIPSVDS